MKFFRVIINFFQILIIVLWTAVCGVIGMLLMLIVWNGKWVHHINGRILWSPLVCAITGVRVVAHGLEKIDMRTSKIYVANHQSHFDIVALARVMPMGLFFIAKKELAKVPIMGQYMHLIGHIFVDRKNKESAMQSMRAAAAKIKSGKDVISFPEGTRSRYDQIQIFKRGSFIIAKEGKVDICPIAIKGSRKILPSGSYAIKPGTIHVFIGDTITAESTEHLSVDELANKTRNVIADLLYHAESTP